LVLLVLKELLFEQDQLAKNQPLVVLLMLTSLELNSVVSAAEN
jgi:hypothetical protein